MSPSEGNGLLDVDQIEAVEVFGITELNSHGEIMIQKSNTC